MNIMINIIITIIIIIIDHYNCNYKHYYKHHLNNKYNYDYIYYYFLILRIDGFKVKRRNVNNSVTVIVTVISVNNVARVKCRKPWNEIQYLRLFEII